MKQQSIVLILYLLLFTGHRLYSQEFKIGFLAGMDVSKIYFRDLPGESSGYIIKPMLSYNLNAYFAYKSKGIFGASVEPGFIQKGYTQKLQAGNVSCHLNYLQMPFLADLWFTDKLYFSIGPEIAYLLSAKLKTQSDRGDISDLYSKYKVEISAISGLNYSINSNFNTGLRYSLGLSKIREVIYTDENGYLIATPGEYNQYLQLVI